MPRPVPWRGVIEGFYGPPWTHDARLEVMEFLAGHDMNAYVYAPKSDPRHRERWRERYDRAELGRHAAFAARCVDLGVRFGFAISPGLDIAYGDPHDRAALLDKLAPIADAGIEWFVLALDDIPNRPGLAVEHAELAGWLLEELRSRRGSAAKCALVPTEYLGTSPGEYVHALGRRLPPAVEVFWTGPTVCSPSISSDDVAPWRAALGARPILVWDNYPVNDAVMERELHLGPYRGRDPAISDAVEGILCNPMLQPHASLVPLATAAEFLRDPVGYDEVDAWELAIAEVGRERAPSLRAIARACCDGPLAPPDQLPASAMVDALEDRVDGSDWVDPVAELRDELSALRASADSWPEPDPLRDELAPWLDQAAREADAGMAALRLIQQTHALAAPDPASPPIGVDPDRAMTQAFVTLFVWSAAREAATRVVLGPRFSLHPAVVQRPDGAPALDIDLALREGASIVDRIVHVALARYQRVMAAPLPLAESPIGADRLPFPDPRLPR